MPTSPFLIDDAFGAWDRRPGHYTDFERKMLNDRLLDLKRAYKDFKDAKVHDTTKKWHFFLNDQTLIIICGLFINDIKEFKLIHAPNAGTDNLKRAAYIARWITKLRPIEFDRKFSKESPNQLNNPDMTFLNEEFAIYIFFLYLRGFHEDWFETEIALALASQLRHVFRKRDADRDLLVALAYATQSALAT